MMVIIITIFVILFHVEYAIAVPAGLGMFESVADKVATHVFASPMSSMIARVSLIVNHASKHELSSLNLPSWNPSWNSPPGSLLLEPPLLGLPTWKSPPGHGGRRRGRKAGGVAS